MPGSEWSRLVAEPTAVELDAALAEVRVRAVPIARRNARNAQAMKLMVGALLVGGSFVAGRAYANGGVRVGEEGNSSGNWKGKPELVQTSDDGRPVVTLPTAGPTIQRFHITSWTEWDGERFGESEAWVEGPPGTFLTLDIGFMDDQFQGQVTVISTREHSSYTMWGHVTHAFGASPRGLQLTESGEAHQNLQVPRGRPVLLYPFGRGGFGKPITVVRIEGPDLTAPEGVRWEGFHSNLFEWNRSEFGGRPDAGEVERMRTAGVRIAMPRVGSLRVTPTYRRPMTVVRLSLVGRSDGVDAAMGDIVEIPGLPGLVRTWMSARRVGDILATCFHVRRAVGEGSQADQSADSLQADGCAPLDSRWTPFETLTNQGQRLRMQIVQVPGVNY